MKDNSNEFYQSTIFEQGKGGQVTAFEVCEKAESQPTIRMFFPKVEKTVYRKTGRYAKFIGKTFKAIGFKHTHTIKIIDIYGKKNAVFRCEVVESDNTGTIGHRKNYFCKEIIKQGKIIDKINFLGA